MDNPFDPSILKPGDFELFFTEHDPVDTLIGIKTGMWIAHIEIDAGNGQSLASRNGIGVNIFPRRTSGLVCVRGPIEPFNFNAGLDWFNTKAKGQGYDWKGLATATALTTEGEEGKMFCSEFAVNFYRACGYNPCNPSQAAWRTYPRDMWLMGTFETKWALNSYYA